MCYQRSAPNCPKFNRQLTFLQLIVGTFVKHKINISVAHVVEEITAHHSTTMKRLQVYSHVPLSALYDYSAFVTDKLK